MDSHATLLARSSAPERAAITHLRSLLTQYSGDNAGDDVLRRAVCDAVRELRDDGAKPEEVVVVLKAVLEEAHIHYAELSHAPRLYEAVIKWCIEEYFSVDHV
jgi:hypothetical protein